MKHSSNSTQGCQNWPDLHEYGQVLIFPIHIPNGCHYNPRLVYLLPILEDNSFVFFRKFCPYVWLVFKSGLSWCRYGSRIYLSTISKELTMNYRSDIPDTYIIFLLATTFMLQELHQELH